MSKKRNKNSRALNSYETRNRIQNPSSFFKKIGIKSLTGKNEGRSITHLWEVIKRLLGEKTADAFGSLWNDADKQFLFCHKNLELVKIWYGTDFERTTAIALELGKLPVPPKSRVLDIGGGPGHLAFWMAHAWDVTELTVADMFPNLGDEWARKIGETRVKFIDTELPDLNGITDHSYDIVVISRVLGFMDSLSLPSSTKELTAEVYFEGKEAKRLLSELGTIAEGIKRVIAPGGRVIVVDSWSDFRVQLVGRAFESKGLFIDLSLFSPEHVSINPSVIVFSESVDSRQIQDIPLGLSTMIYLGKGGTLLEGASAESLLKLFEDVEPVIQIEYCIKDYNNIKVKDKVFEKYGLSLFYRSTADGGRLAVMNSSIVIPEHIEGLEALRSRKGACTRDNVVMKNWQ